MILTYYASNQSSAESTTNAELVLSIQTIEPFEQDILRAAVKNWYSSFSNMPQPTLPYKAASGEVLELKVDFSPLELDELYVIHIYARTASLEIVAAYEIELSEPYVEITQRIHDRMSEKSGRRSLLSIQDVANILNINAENNRKAAEK